MLSDRVFYPLAALIAVLLILLATVYPQGQGARSPKPFGHATWAQTHPPKPPLKPGDHSADKAKLKGAL
jgi:hypothetical protein